MKKYLLLATVSDRLDMALTMLRSAERFLPDWRIHVVAQELSPSQQGRLRAALPEGSVFTGLPLRIGPHRAKLYGLKELHRVAGPGPYVVCSADDDMEFVPETNLEPAVARAMEQGVGFVSAGWVNHENRIPGHITRDVFVTQPIVYTGGGMIFSHTVAALIRDMPDVPYFSDNVEWSLRAYLAGYRNERYRGSLTIHRVCKKGGRRGWVELKARVLSDPRYIKITEGKVGGHNRYLIGTSADLTAEALIEHKRNRARLGIAR